MCIRDSLRSARARIQGGAWVDIVPEDLTQYVSEELNPENNKGVAGIEVFCPNPLLAQGMCFVDTPEMCIRDRMLSRRGPPRLGLLLAGMFFRQECRGYNC